MNGRKTASLFAMLAACLALLAAGCSSVGVRTGVLRPAEWDGAVGRLIAVGRIDGRGGTAVQRAVVNRLAGSQFARFTNDPSLAELLLNGRVTEYYSDERFFDWVDTCGGGHSPPVTGKKGDRGQERLCVMYKQFAEARVKVVFELVDPATGAVIAAKSASCSDQDSAITQNKPPEHINAETMLRKCTKTVAEDVVRAVSPWVENVRVVLYKDKALPQLETGIQAARRGQWDEAADLFAEAVRWAEESPAVDDETRGRACGNLGLALMFTQQYDEAARYLGLARDLTGDEKYDTQIAELQRMRAEGERLQDQLAP